MADPTAATDKEPQPKGWGPFKASLGKFTSPAAQKKDKESYDRAYTAVAGKLKALPAVDATPPPLKPLRQEVDEAETQRADLMKAAPPNYIKGKELVAGLGETIEAFTAATKQFVADKKAYEKNYKGLDVKVGDLPDEALLSAPAKKWRQHVLDVDAKRADLVSDAKQDFAVAKDVALELKKKIDTLENGLDVQTKLAGDPIDAAALKKAAAKPGGTDALDDLVDSLPQDKTKEKVIAAALKARFSYLGDVTEYENMKKDAKGNTSYDVDKSLKRVDDNLPDKSLYRFYQVLKTVPESHTRGNPKLSKIQRYTKEKGGAAYGSKTIYLNTQIDDIPNELCAKDELPEVDDDCKPKDMDKSKRTMPYFDFASLHEVGHAVDDKTSFMDKNGAKDEYGGWRPQNVGTVADAGAKKFGAIWKTYIQSVLSGGKATLPKKPDATPQADWDGTKGDIDKWCGNVAGQRIWWDGAASKDCAVGDRVYQQSYDGEWWSYQLAARKKGISGYMFRAPGEWFAEIYAAFYSGVLKENNPHVAFLQGLEKPTK